MRKKISPYRPSETTPSWIRAPPESLMPITGQPVFIARSMTLTIFSPKTSPRRAAEDREVLREDADRPAVDGAVAGDHAVAVRAGSCPSPNAVERCRASSSSSTKRALVEQHLDPLAGGLLAPGVLLLHRARRARRAPPRRPGARGRRAARRWCGCRPRRCADLSRPDRNDGSGGRSCAVRLDHRCSVSRRNAPFVITLVMMVVGLLFLIGGVAVLLTMNRLLWPLAESGGPAGSPGLPGRTPVAGGRPGPARHPRQRLPTKTSARDRARAATVAAKSGRVYRAANRPTVPPRDGRRLAGCPARRTPISTARRCSARALRTGADRARRALDPARRACRDRLHQRRRGRGRAGRRAGGAGRGRRAADRRARPAAAAYGSRRRAPGSR